MNLTTQFFKKVNNNFSDWDIGFLKLYGGIPGLIFGAFFPEIVKRYLWVLIPIFAVLLVRYSYLIFFKKSE